MKRNDITISVVLLLCSTPIAYEAIALSDVLNDYAISSVHPLKDMQLNQQNESNEVLDHIFEKETGNTFLFNKPHDPNLTNLEQQSTENESSIENTHIKGFTKQSNDSEGETQKTPQFTIEPNYSPTRFSSEKSSEKTEKTNENLNSETTENNWLMKTTSDRNSTIVSILLNSSSITNSEASEIFGTAQFHTYPYKVILEQNSTATELGIQIENSTDFVANITDTVFSDSSNLNTVTKRETVSGTISDKSSVTESLAAVDFNISSELSETGTENHINIVSEAQNDSVCSVCQNCTDDYIDHVIADVTAHLPSFLELPNRQGRFQLYHGKLFGLNTLQRSETANVTCRRADDYTVMVPLKIQNAKAFYKWQVEMPLRTFYGDMNVTIVHTEARVFYSHHPKTGSLVENLEILKMDGIETEFSGVGVLNSLFAGTTRTLIRVFRGYFARTLENTLIHVINKELEDEKKYEKYYETKS